MGSLVHAFPRIHNLTQLQHYDTRLQVDPSGEHDATRRCQHVNYVTKRAVGLADEQEYLFTQYAPFQV